MVTLVNCSIKKTTFVEGHTNVLVKIPIEGSGFLAIGTTFTATLITVNFLGAGGIILIEL
jgi:hypothetical protein